LVILSLQQPVIFLRQALLLECRGKLVILLETVGEWVDRPKQAGQERVLEIIRVTAVGLRPQTMGQEAQVLEAGVEQAVLQELIYLVERQVMVALAGV